MADPKKVVQPTKALVDKSPGPVTPPEEKKPTWKFEQLSGVGGQIKFADGTSYTFPLLRSAFGGYLPISSMVTDDPKLAENLRRCADNKQFNVKEIK
jgi:hypothetical protein